jgi:hypothetical protein
MLIHLYVDDTIQVSILYECNLLIDDDTRFRLLSSKWSISKRCESRDSQYFYLVRLSSIIYLIDKTFRLYSMLVLILNEKWKKFSLSIENDDKKNSLLENDISKT